MMQLLKRRASKDSVANNEISASVFIPYYCHWDRETILTHDKEMLQVVKLEGFAFETADDEDVDMKKAVRNSLLRSMAKGSISIWFHTVRRRQSQFPKGKMPVDGFADHLNKEWKRKHVSHDSYVNEMYITIIHKADTKGAAKIEHMLRSLYQTADKQSREQAMKENHKELQEMTQRVLATLKDYNPKVLSVVQTPKGAFSEPLEFLGSLVNCGVRQPVLVPSMDISHYLPNQRLYFGRRAIEARGATGKRYAAIVSVKEYAPQTAAGMMDSFLQLPFEFIISQSLTYINRQTAIEKMQIQQNRMIQAEDVAVSQVAEISEALDMAMSGHVGFGQHHMSVLCIEDSLKSLEDAVSMTIAELVNVGINAQRETLNMEPAYWSQLPANFEYIARKATVNTMNVAAFASFHNYPVGKISGNHWGSAVTVFETASGTPYYFNFHLRDVGHTTIIGPTGAGKTVLMNFLVAQAQKFKCRVFFFDKDRGAEIFIRALGGVYNIIDPGENCGFNPLQLSDTMDNRAFLAEWLKALISSSGEQITADDMALIQEAISGNYKMPKEDRILNNVAPFFGLEGPGTVAGRLRTWHSEGPYAKIFDNPIDTIDFDKADVFGFEMGEVLSNRATLGPVLLYLFHKISMSLDGTPTIIVLDEAWALIDNDVFAPKIRDWLKTLRKLNAMVVFATQSVEDATKSNISDTLVQQTATQIFLPNPKATDVYRKTFMLSEREFHLLKTTDIGSRFFLVKQGGDVVVARIDLSGMEEVINVLSGRAETVAILDEVRKEVGDDPQDWMPLFQERVQRLKDSVQKEED